MVWQRCEGVRAHDALTGQWQKIGDPGRADLMPEADDEPGLEGAGSPVLESTMAAMSADRYHAAVVRAIGLIRAGDVYQVNVARWLEARLAVPPRAFAAALIGRAAPWYGGYIEHMSPDGRVRAVCSASPELFLDIDPAAGQGGQPRRIVTRPMKGTLAGRADPGLLAASAKDRAELDMIVDLMRNDLGRVCRTGSVRVEDRRTIERHAVSPGPGRGGPASGLGAALGSGVWQGVATVAGLLRPRTTLLELLRAVFPAGSITGAPKIRAMQVIEELEGRPRGPYCGCVGFIGDDGRVALNVAIRTALLEPSLERPGDPAGAIVSADWLASWPVGAGIVADSDPEREWQETLDKAQVFLGLAATSTKPVAGFAPAGRERG